MNTGKIALNQFCKDSFIGIYQQMGYSVIYIATFEKKSRTLRPTAFIVTRCQSRKNHLKLLVVHPEISGGPFSAIAFQQGDQIVKIEKGIPFNMCYHIEENEWNGSVTLQLNGKDIKFES